jgi:lipid-binding SYLF domain-containing protein
MQIKVLMAACAVLMGMGVMQAACAAEEADTTADADSTSVYKRAMESRGFFDTAYGYAVFPTVGEGGLILGAALGKGRVYVHGKLVGDAKLKQLSAGLQAGGKAYSEIIFFEDKRALDEFESGKFEFSAGASAIAITASAGASAGTNGVQANASGTENNATTVGQYNKGMAVFTIAKGGLMYAAAIAGQKFSYKSRGAPAEQ